MDSRQLNTHRAACTIVSPNYLPFARTLSLSYTKHHPEHEFFVLVVGRNIDKKLFSEELFIPISLEEIGIANLPSLGMKYGILELNTNVKPQFMLFLLERYSLDSLIYLDPDIYVYSPLDPISALLQQHDVILTPHITSPAPDDDWRIEQDILSNGSYNLGFLAIRRSVESRKFLLWWCNRCLEGGFSEGRTGLFVDQKWVNLAPSLFQGIALCKDLGCNMAIWNLHEREISKNDGIYWVNRDVPLRFFHFSGIALDSSGTFFRNPSRYSNESRPDLLSIFQEYRRMVSDNRRPLLDDLPYGFSHFDNGRAVTVMARRVYAAHEDRFSHEDPFVTISAFYRFVRSQGLLAGRDSERRVGWKEFNGNDRRVVWIHKILRLTLRLVGPTRYELLMKYLGHISVLRNQGIFIK